MSYALRSAAQGSDHPFGTVHSDQGVVSRNERILASAIAQKRFPTGDELQVMFTPTTHKVENNQLDTKASDTLRGSVFSRCPPMDDDRWRPPAHPDAQNAGNELMGVREDMSQRPPEKPDTNHRDLYQNMGHELKGIPEDSSKKNRTLVEFHRLLRQIDHKLTGQEERLNHFMIEHERRIIKAFEDALENKCFSPGQGQCLCPGQSQAAAQVPVPRATPQNLSQSPETVPLAPPRQNLNEKAAFRTYTDAAHAGNSNVNCGLVSIASEHVEDSSAWDVKKAAGDVNQVPQVSGAHQVVTAEDETRRDDPMQQVIHWDKVAASNAAGHAAQVPQSDTHSHQSKSRTVTSQIDTQMTKSKSRTLTSKFSLQIAEYCELEIIEAQGLLASDMAVNCCNVSKSVSSDPYVKVLLGQQDSKESVYRSSTQKKTVNPVWNAFCKFKIDQHEMIVLELWDEDPLFLRDDLLGRVFLKKSDMPSSGEHLTRWFDLTPQEDCPGATGKILLRASLLTKSKTASLDSSAYFSLLGAEADVDDLVTDELDELGNDLCSSCPLFAKFQTLVTHPRFDGYFVGCIVLNALCMMVELEYSGRKAQPDENNVVYWPELESALKVLNTFFAITFIVELLLRLTAFGYKFLTHWANWLDIIVVLTSVLEILGTSTIMNLSFLRLIRLSKLTRLLRMMVMATFCNPLRILMKAIYTGFGSLFWSFVLLLMIEVVAGMFMTQMLAESVTDENLDLEMRSFIYTHFGTTSRSILTMFQITMAPGAWGLIGRPLVEEVSPAFAWFFVLYVGGVSFAIIRIITALFLRQTLAVAAGDEQMMKQEKIKSQRKYTESVRDLFLHVNPSGTGEVTFDEFQQLLMDEHVTTWLQVLELNPKNASYIFELCDDGDGRLTLDEFLSGVFRLKGTAQQIDMVLLQREAKEIRGMMSKLWEHTLEKERGHNTHLCKTSHMESVVE